MIEAAGPKLTFSSQKESSPRSRTLSGGFILISGLSRGGCMCVCVFIQYVRVSAELCWVAGGAWLTVSLLASLFELCQQ